MAQVTFVSSFVWIKVRVYMDVTVTLISYQLLIITGIAIEFSTLVSLYIIRSLERRQCGGLIL